MLCFCLLVFCILYLLLLSINFNVSLSIHGLLAVLVSFSNTPSAAYNILCLVLVHLSSIKPTPVPLVLTRYSLIAFWKNPLVSLSCSFPVPHLSAFINQFGSRKKRETREALLSLRLIQSGRLRVGKAKRGNHENWELMSRTRLKYYLFILTWKWPHFSTNFSMQYAWFSHLWNDARIFDYRIIPSPNNAGIYDSRIIYIWSRAKIILPLNHSPQNTGTSTYRSSVRHSVACCFYQSGTDANDIYRLCNCHFWRQIRYIGY